MSEWSTSLGYCAGDAFPDSDEEFDDGATPLEQDPVLNAVDEETVKFTKTPFTIAARNANLRKARQPAQILGGSKEVSPHVTGQAFPSLQKPPVPSLVIRTPHDRTPPSVGPVVTSSVATLGQRSRTPSGQVPTPNISSEVIVLSSDSEDEVQPPRVFSRERPVAEPSPQDAQVDTESERLLQQLFEENHDFYQSLERTTTRNAPTQAQSEQALQRVFDESRCSYDSLDRDRPATRRSGSHTGSSVRLESMVADESTAYATTSYAPTQAYRFNQPRYEQHRAYERPSTAASGYQYDDWSKYFDVEHSPMATHSPYGYPPQPYFHHTYPAPAYPPRQHSPMAYPPAPYPPETYAPTTYSPRSQYPPINHHHMGHVPGLPQSSYHPAYFPPPPSSTWQPGYEQLYRAPTPAYTATNSQLYPSPYAAYPHNAEAGPSNFDRQRTPRQAQEAKKKADVVLKALNQTSKRSRSTKEKLESYLHKGEPEWSTLKVSKARPDGTLSLTAAARGPLIPATHFANHVRGANRLAMPLFRAVGTSAEARRRAETLLLGKPSNGENAIPGSSKLAQKRPAEPTRPPPPKPSKLFKPSPLPEPGPSRTQR